MLRVLLQGQAWLDGTLAGFGKAAKSLERTVLDEAAVRDEQAPIVTMRPANAVAARRDERGR